MQPLMDTPKKRMNPLSVVLLLSGGFFVLFLILSSVIFFARGPSRGGSSVGGGLFSSGGAVAVIELNGVIMDSKKVLRKIEAIEEDPSIAGVVIRINSPGGAVAPSQEIYDAVKRMKKPVVSSMASVAASGGYYVAAATKKIYANPGTITGSIGVIMEFANLEKLYEWAKIRRFSIKTGRFKDAGSEYRAMAPEERALFQGMIDDVLLQFKQAVVDGRKLTMAQVTEVADGRIFSGAQAKKAKLVDELGSLDDAIKGVAEMAKIKGKPDVIYPRSPRKRLIETILEDATSDEADSEEESRLSWASIARAILGPNRGSESVFGRAPGIYWLWTGAP